jgi:SAM-dependent methyltransferase
MRELVKRIPILGTGIQQIYRRLLARKGRRAPFAGSAAYWEQRYSSGGNSGVGSYALFGEFKADVVNRFVGTHDVRDVIEFGCGDGNQLSLAEYPAYLGFDVSSTAIARCRERFRADTRKSFRVMGEYRGESADLALSLDVIYHLVEDDVFEKYMRTLFAAAKSYVIIYSSDSDDNRVYEGTHIRHRKVTGWIQGNCHNWNLVEHVPNRYPYRGDCRTGSFAEYFVYEKV